jgi:hypothetical protein
MELFSYNLSQFVHCFGFDKLIFYPATLLKLFMVSRSFNDDMSWGSSTLVKSVWCPGGFLYLNGQSFLADDKILYLEDPKNSTPKLLDLGNFLLLFY